MQSSKRKVSPQEEAPDKENAKRPAITGLLDASIASRFLRIQSSPIHEFVVQMAQQLLEALQASTVVEDGTFNDSAFEHFALVMRIWRNEVFNCGIQGMFVKGCVVSDIIDKLSNEVENEQIGERMCRMKADHNLSDIILQLKRPPATMIRGLLIILLGYWTAFGLCFDGDCGHKGHKVAEDGYGIIERDIVSDMKIGTRTPIQMLEDESFIEELAHDLKQDSRLFGKAQQCMEFLHIFDPKDDGSLFSAKLHHDLAHEVLEDPDFIQLLVKSLQRDFYGRGLVDNRYGKRAKVKNDDVLATVTNIVKDLGCHQYKDQIEKNEVCAVRVFLTRLIARADAWKATGYDDVEAKICYVTRFAGDLKGLREELDKVYGTRPYKHIFYELKIMQFRPEVSARRKQFDVKVKIKAHLYNGLCPCSTGKTI
ncbi:anhydro-N-acetylmuramic acid kinase [Striga asiatica]|uniref:Anhydro-N-acetylmuramic acid kinase n=1 Tax=Striga asiatica TaxID=4170 RepID=A0A5A7R9F0_STRAF|nr:anhydro-N-acetylmuramic acid kinase [Striga asiatica]